MSAVVSFKPFVGLSLFSRVPFYGGLFRLRPATLSLKLVHHRHHRHGPSWQVTLDGHSSAYPIKALFRLLLLNVLTDPFLGYFRNVYIFGQEYTVAQALTKIAGGVTFVNSVASTVCAVILYLALRPALERAGLLPKGEKH